MNVDNQRMPHESDVEWGLRRCFLEAHQNSFAENENRLLCLASCFINIEMYGCAYPDEVMAEVRILTDDITDDVQAFRSNYQAHKDIQFVKEADSQSGSISSKGNETSRKREDTRRGGRKRKQNLQDALSSKKEFYILQPKTTNEQPAHGILHTSSEFSKQPLNWDIDNTDQGFRCAVGLHGEILGEAVAMTVQNAKRAASEIALALLRTRCWTFQVKQSADSDESGITRNEILGDEAKADQAIPTTNIGSKMMRLMGWGGGGIGKKEQGIAEPISVNTVINREGLGMMTAQGIKKDFLPQIKTTIKEYAISYKEGDLLFAPDFTKEERALIHSECKKLNLKSVSHGHGEDRFLVVSRKRTPTQLFAMVQAAGGESSKYRLIPPGTVPAVKVESNELTTTSPQDCDEFDDNQ